MPQIIKNDAVVEDSWQVIPKDFEGVLPSGPLLVHVDRFQALKSEGHQHPLAPWLDSDDDVEALAPSLVNEPLIAVHFPAFSDGRGFSSGRLLRDRFGFKGELRAIGSPIQDQLFYLRRCGFDAFDLRAGTDLNAALQSLDVFSVRYQTAIDTPSPLFRRRV